jgi:hypothetical protein
MTDQNVYSIKTLCNKCKCVRRFQFQVGRDGILKPTTGNESVHVMRNDNGVRLVNFSTSERLIVKESNFSAS